MLGVHQEMVGVGNEAHETSPSSNTAATRRRAFGRTGPRPRAPSACPRALPPRRDRIRNRTPRPSRHAGVQLTPLALRFHDGRRSPEPAGLWRAAKESLGKLRSISPRHHEVAGTRSASADRPREVCATCPVSPVVSGSRALRTEDCGVGKDSPCAARPRHSEIPLDGHRHRHAGVSANAHADSPRASHSLCCKYRRAASSGQAAKVAGFAMYMHCLRLLGAALGRALGAVAAMHALHVAAAAALALGVARPGRGASTRESQSPQAGAAGSAHGAAVSSRVGGRSAQDSGRAGSLPRQLG